MTSVPAFRLRSVAYVAYGPATVSSIANGAVTPIVALRARDLGASVSAAVAPVAVASLAIGVFALVGTVWVGYWTRQDDLRRQREPATARTTGTAATTAR